MRIPGLELDARVRDVPWRPTSSAGVEWFLLAGEGEAAEEGARGATPGATVLIRMAPGHGYPPHRHAGIEEVLVLAGGYRDHLGEHRAGDYVRYEAGSEHAPIALGDAKRAPAADNPACVLYATARGGITPLGDG